MKGWKQLYSHFKNSSAIHTVFQSKAIAKTPEINSKHKNCLFKYGLTKLTCNKSFQWNSQALFPHILIGGCPVNTLHSMGVGENCFYKITSHSKENICMAVARSVIRVIGRSQAQKTEGPASFSFVTFTFLPQNLVFPPNKTLPAFSILRTILNM